MPLLPKSVSQSFETIFREVKDVNQHDVKIEQPEDPALCSECGKTFTRKSNLTQHIKSAHSDVYFECWECHFRSVFKHSLKRHIAYCHTNVEQRRIKREKEKEEERKANELLRISYTCVPCDKHFRTGKLLKLHQKRIHLVQKRKFECTICQKIFSRQDNLKRHEKDCHGHGAEGPSLYECANCSKLFKRKLHLADHIPMCEKIQTFNLAKAKRFKCLIPNCEAEFNDQFSANMHYEAKHGVQLIRENFKFETRAKFKEWLVNLQRNTTSQFSVCNVWKTSTSIKRKMVCHRSGFEAVEPENRVRFLKSCGSKKLNGYCPAQMNVKENYKDKTYVVDFQKTHVGHTIGCEDELPFLSLDKKEKKEITSKLASGVPFDAVLSKCESPLQSPAEQFDRKDAISLVDIANLSAAAGLNSAKPAPFTDDTKNVLNFIFENKENILLFKSEGTPDEDYGILEEKDFAIVYMDEFQRELLQKFGNNVIAYDSTPKTNPNDFLLHSILIFDEEWEGVAVAFLISNRNDFTVLEIFLDCIKKQVGLLTPTVVVTDMEPTFHSTFEVVMGRAEFSFWNWWYVYEKWRQQQCKIKNADKRRQTLVLLYNLSQVASKDVFHANLTDFLDNPDPDLEEFLGYFSQHFADKPEYWAYCYRIDSDVDVNLTLESFHNYSKGKIAKRKKMKTVYQCLCSIQTYLTIKKNYRKVKEVRPPKTSKLKTLQSRHHEARKCYPIVQIQPYEGDEYPTWLITSFPSFKKIKKERRIGEKSKPVDEDVYLESDTENSNAEDKGDERTNNADAKYGIIDFRTYIVQHHIDRPIKSDSLKCSMCKISFEEYSCTCVDYLIRSNMCKHIHAAGMYRKENSGSNILSASAANIMNNDRMINHDVCHVEEDYLVDEINFTDDENDFANNEEDDADNVSDFAANEDDSASDIEEYKRVIINEISNMKNKKSLQNISQLVFCDKPSPFKKKKTQEVLEQHLISSEELEMILSS